MFLKYHCLKERKHEGDHEKNELLRSLRDDTVGKSFQAILFPWNWIACSYLKRKYTGLNCFKFGFDQTCFGKTLRSNSGA